tara:strand:- start:335 stop:568 length:234 start_codon:yes stop_codon:yes gene_type:complete
MTNNSERKEISKSDIQLKNERMDNLRVEVEESFIQVLEKYKGLVAKDTYDQILDDTFEIVKDDDEAYPPQTYGEEII